MENEQIGLTKAGLLVTGIGLTGCVATYAILEYMPESARPTALLFGAGSFLTLVTGATSAAVGYIQNERQYGNPPSR